MLTSQLTTRTYLINSEIFEIGYAVPLSVYEQDLLDQVVELTQQITNSRISIFERCVTILADVDAELAADYYMFEDLGFRHRTTSTRLLRAICARLGGILPMSIEVYSEPPRVTVRALQPGESVVIDREQVANGSMYNRAVGDINAMLPVFLGVTSRAEVLDHIICKPANWQEDGCPNVTLKTGALGLDRHYADGLTKWAWTEHENREVDRLVTLGIGRVLGQPGRIHGIQTRTSPLPMIGVIVGTDQTQIMNLTEVNEQNDGYRLTLLKRSIERLHAWALFLVQFGPLDQRNSAVDMQQGVQQPQGITVSAVIRNDLGLIMGGKSWTIQQQTQQTPPALMTYGVFEDTPGLAGPDPEAVIRSLFSGMPSLELPEIMERTDGRGTGDGYQRDDEPLMADEISVDECAPERAKMPTRVADL